MFIQIKRQVTRLVFFSRDCFYPVECLACHRSGLWLCLACRSQVVSSESQVCPICKIPNEFGAVHGKCHSYLDAVLVMGAYQGLLKRAIRSFKYHFASEIGQELAQILSEFVQTQIQSWQIDYIIPVPLSARRYRWRGFNQSSILATAIAEAITRPLDCHSLVKIKDTKPQAKLSWSERLQFDQKNFHWQGSDLHGQGILIVDDVMTTGQTLEVIAKTLKLAGADKVYAIVLARGH